MDVDDAISLQSRIHILEWNEEDANERLKWDAWSTVLIGPKSDLYFHSKLYVFLFIYRHFVVLCVFHVVLIALEIRCAYHFVLYFRFIYFFLLVCFCFIAFGAWFFFVFRIRPRYYRTEEEQNKKCANREDEFKTTTTTTTKRAYI